MSEQKYFGLYCAQCGTWWIEPDASRLVFYPAPEIANAHLKDEGWFRAGAVHLWKVQEFGKEERRNPRYLNPEFRCPLAVVKINE